MFNLFRAFTRHSIPVPQIQEDTDTNLVHEIIPINQQIISFNDILAKINSEGFDFSNVPKEELVTLDRCKKCRACLYHRPSYPREGRHGYMCGLNPIGDIEDIAICKYTGEFYDGFFQTDKITYAEDFNQAEFKTDFIKYHMDNNFGTSSSSVNKESVKKTMSVIFAGYRDEDGLSDKKLNVYLDRTVFEGSSWPLKPQFHDLLTLDNKEPIGKVIKCDTTSGIATFLIEEKLAKILSRCIDENNLELRFVKSHLEYPSHGRHFPDALFFFVKGDKVIFPNR